MITQYIKPLGAAFLAALIFTQPSLAGKDLDEEAVKLEISYLAKRILDLTGKDTYTITSEAVVKPFIGICTELKESGVKLTCITPDSQAARAGLLTGDLITEINGLSMAGQKSRKESYKGNYWSLVKSIKPGDELKMKLERDGKSQSLDVIVGSLSHPAYSCDISKG
ncbi:MAG: PDZ domain-containing protein [Arenicella sp.]|nr:PDZ domain-containing protein [Arenicella sp.]